MLLDNKTAVIYGGGGAIGGAIARTFASEGAHVALVGRTEAKLAAVANDITTAGGSAELAVVDALDERAVADHADAVATSAGAIDVAVNAVGVVHVQDTPLGDLSLADFEQPIATYTRTCFVTAKAVGKHMQANGSGAILTLSPPGARVATPGILGFGVACAAIEGFSRLLAAELGPAGVRVVHLRPHAVPEAAAAGSHSREVFAPAAETAGVSVEEMVETMLREGNPAALLGRFPTLTEVADAAAFMASDRAGAMTATVANLTCGSVLD